MTRISRKIAAGFMLLVVAASVVGCASHNGDSDTVLTGTASQPNVPTVSSPSTPGPNDPLSQFERQRMLNRLQQDPQHQISRLSVRERRDLAAIAQAASNTKKKKDDEE